MVNKKAQIEFSTVIFIVVIFGVLIATPLVLKVFNSVLDPISTQFGALDNASGQNVQAIYTDAVSFWDWIVIVAFAVNVILLFLSAFLIDTHPFFLVIFIIFGLFTFILAPLTSDGLKAIYQDSNFGLEVSQAPLSEWLVNNFVWVMVGVWFITGVILYGKFRFGGTVY